MDNEIKLTVLEYKTGTFEGNAYAHLLARYDGRIMKFKLGKGVPDLSSAVDRDVSAFFEIVAGQNLAATIRITKIVI